MEIKHASLKSPVAEGRGKKEIISLHLQIVLWNDSRVQRLRVEMWMIK
jgi:hypothetical protein